MKKCATCHQDKAEEHFSKSKAEKDGLQPRCKECTRDYYQQNKQTHIARVAIRRKALVQENHLRMMEYLKTVVCMDCGESDPIVIEFDHVREKKVANVSTLLSWASWEVVLAEITKCDPVCANCHRRRTAKRGLHYRYALVA